MTAAAKSMMEQAVAKSAVTERNGSSTLLQSWEMWRQICSGSEKLERSNQCGPDTAVASHQRWSPIQWSGRKSRLVKYYILCLAFENC